MKIFAIHTVHRKPDPKGEVEVRAAGAVFDGTKEELAQLSRDGAARAATKVDEAAYAERLAEEERRRQEIDPLAISPAPDLGTGEDDGLDSKTKAELHKLIEERGLTVETDANKARLLEVLRSADVPPAD